MRIVSYMHSMKLFILDDGGSISTEAYPEFRVGMQLEYSDGEYRLAQSAEGCAT